MEREDFFKLVAEDYYKEKTITFDSLKQTITTIMPVFGELRIHITETNDGNHITFIDNDVADTILIPDGYIPSEDDYDMSSSLFSLSVNDNGIVQVIEHGFNIFTPANKDNVLFLASLIGKKILY